MQPPCAWKQIRLFFPLLPTWPLLVLSAGAQRTSGVRRPSLTSTHTLCLTASSTSWYVRAFFARAVWQLSKPERLEPVYISYCLRAPQRTSLDAPTGRAAETQCGGQPSQRPRLREPGGVYVFSVSIAVARVDSTLTALHTCMLPELAVLATSYCLLLTPTLPRFHAELSKLLPELPRHRQHSRDARQPSETVRPHVPGLARSVGLLSC